MKLKLKTEWMGNPPGVVLDLRDAYAKVLVLRGVAKEVQEVKEVVTPEVNKMVGQAEVSKGPGLKVFKS